MYQTLEVSGHPKPIFQLEGPLDLFYEMGYIVTSAKQGRLIRIQEEDINQFIVTEQIYMTSNGTHLLVNLQNVWNNQKETYTFYQNLLARFMQKLFIYTLILLHRAISNCNKVNFRRCHKIEAKTFEDSTLHTMLMEIEIRIAT